jgi:putative transposase
MAKQQTPWDARQIYEFIKAHRRQFDVALMCSTLGVTRSGFYAWLDSPVSKRGRDNDRLLRLIKASHSASHGIYGSPRMFLDLREIGETCSTHRVARAHAQAQDPSRTRISQTVLPSLQTIDSRTGPGQTAL